MLPTIIVTGRLTRDPKLSYTPSQTAVCEFGVASSEKYGDDKENKCFLDCVAWGKQGETLNKYFVKGKPIQITGSLKTEQWQAKDGSNRSKQVCNVLKWAFVPADTTKETTGEKPLPTKQQIDDAIERNDDTERTDDNTNIPF